MNKHMKAFKTIHGHTVKVLQMVIVFENLLSCNTLGPSLVAAFYSNSWIILRGSNYYFVYR